jgi:hypothetical protein
MAKKQNTAERIPVTIGFNHDKVVGRVTLNEEATNLLMSGGVVISASISYENPDQPKLVGVTLLPDMVIES